MRPMKKYNLGLAGALRLISGGRPLRPPRGLRGYGKYGPGVTAVLYIGRKTGLNLGRWREGATLPDAVVDRIVFRARERQVGPLLVGGNLTRLSGWYKGQPERTVKFEVAFEPTSRERTPRAFIKNVQTFAQAIAKSLAQREVIVKWDGPGRRGLVETASPTGAPSPTSPKFAAWVKAHSR